MPPGVPAAPLPPRRPSPPPRPRSAGGRAKGAWPAARLRPRGGVASDAARSGGVGGGHVFAAPPGGAPLSARGRGRAGARLGEASWAWPEGGGVGADWRRARGGAEGAGRGEARPSRIGGGAGRGGAGRQLTGPGGGAAERRGDGRGAARGAALSAGGTPWTWTWITSGPTSRPSSAWWWATTRWAKRASSAPATATRR